MRHIMETCLELLLGIRPLESWLSYVTPSKHLRSFGEEKMRSKKREVQEVGPVK